METADALGFLKRLKVLHKTKKCKECEKLHGALAQLRIYAPILKFQIDALKPTKYHRAPACQTCLPGRVWTDMLSEDDE